MSGQREGSAPVRPQPAWLSDLPGMVAQWHPTRNEPLDPLTLRVGSHRRVWWQCAQGHEWQAKVGSRTRRETGCPVCSVRRVSPTRNLAALYPEVATTWHPTANVVLVVRVRAGFGARRPALVSSAAVQPPVFAVS